MDKACDSKTDYYRRHQEKLWHTSDDISAVVDKQCNRAFVGYDHLQAIKELLGEDRVLYHQSDCQGVRLQTDGQVFHATSRVTLLLSTPVRTGDK